MILPVGSNTFSDSLRMGAEIFHSLKSELSEAGHSINVGDEGGFAPALNSTSETFDYILKSVERAGYKVGEEVFLALVAACAWSPAIVDDKHK